MRPVELAILMRLYEQKETTGKSLLRGHRGVSLRDMEKAGWIEYTEDGVWILSEEGLRVCEKENVQKAAKKGFNS